MWLYFNSNGQLIKILEHGTPARVGTSAFSIFAVFENIPDETALLNFEATIKLRKPDLTGSEYPLLLMSRASAVFNKLSNEGNVEPFVDGDTYYGFLFDFAEFNPDEGEALLDTGGLWEAIITVISGANFNVQGVATFNVEGTGSEDATVITYDIVTNQIMHNLPFLVSKKQAIIVIPDLEADVSSYDLGQLFYNKDNKNIYILSENEQHEPELALYQSFNSTRLYKHSIVFSDDETLEIINNSPEPIEYWEDLVSAIQNCVYSKYKIVDSDLHMIFSYAVYGAGDVGQDADVGFVFYDINSGSDDSKFDQPTIEVPSPDVVELL